MKKRITKIWGVGLVVVLATSLILSAAPASAGTLSFTSDTSIPSATDNILVTTATLNILDLSVHPDGERMYAATGATDNRLYKSSNGGDTWAGLTMPAALTDVNLVAVAPDDEDIVIAFGNAAGTNLVGYVSTNAGSTWASLGTAQNASGEAATQINDIAISALSGSTRYIACAGQGNTTAAAGPPATVAVPFCGVFYFNLGSAAPAWKNAVGKDFTAPMSDTSSIPDALSSEAQAVEFSPNFASDMILTTVTEETGGVSATAALTTLAGAAAVGNLSGNSYTLVAADVITAASTGTFQISTPTVIPAAWVLTGLEDAGNANTIYFMPGSSMAAAATLGGGAVAAGTACVGNSYAITAGDTIPIGSTIYARVTLGVATVAGGNILTSLVGAGNKVTFTKGAARFNMIALNQKDWNSAAGFTSYPVQLEDYTTAGITFNNANISLDPEYLGGDDTSRIAFVGASITKAAEAGGIYRLKDASLKDMSSTPLGIKSVAWDGTNLVAGPTASNNVKRCADALASSPTVSSSRSYKRPGGAANMIVAWAGENVVCASSGISSSFSRSGDNGKTFNDISLIDHKFNNISDVYVSPDGATTYLMVDDGAEYALWRKTASWERIFWTATAPTTAYIVRALDSDPNVVYIANQGATGMFYATDGGENKWFVRASRYSIGDMAVESADVAYISKSAAKMVSKTTNGGFTWGTEKSTTITSPIISTILSVGDDALIVGGNTGYVGYSTDGNSSWTKITKRLQASAGLLTQVTASGLDDGGYIYASTSYNAVGIGTQTRVERWQIGTSTSWWNMSAPTTVGTAALACYACTGIVLQDGILYALFEDPAAADNSEIVRTLGPTGATSVTWSSIASAGEEFNTVPSALRVSGGSNKLWAIDNGVTTPGTLWSYTDTLATTGVTLSSPPDEYQNPMNPVTGRSTDITFTWEKPSDKVTEYDIEIFADAGCTMRLERDSVVSTSATPSTVMGPYQPAGVNRLIEFSPGKTYYWKVRVSPRAQTTAGNGPIYSPWSEVRSFTVEPGVALVPTILAPTNGSDTVSKLPSFSWDPVSGATEYQFVLASTVSLSPPIVDLKVKTTGFEVTKELEEGKTYYWAVKPIAPVEGGWSAVANFTVKVPAPAPTPPVTVKTYPPPQITIPPAPAPPPAIVIPPAPAPPAPIAPTYIWAIIIIGAILVIAVIVLIVRTRRVV